MGVLAGSLSPLALLRATIGRIEDDNESYLEGVNRKNLKFTNFKHTLCSGLVLEIIRSAEDSSPCQELLNQCG